MSEELLEACADVRAKLYVLPLDDVKVVAHKYVSAFDSTDATRAKTLSVLEEFIGAVCKDEDGAATLKNIAKEIGTMHKTTSEKHISSTGLSEPVATGTYMFRKDFKVSGQIGDLKRGLGFTSYCHQVSDALKKGYRECEIIEGIIRAIEPQNKLRSYLEGRPTLLLGDVNSIIRSFYKEKSATELYQTLSNLTQESKESSQDFLFRALHLRQQVLFASKESGGIEYDENLVQQMTLHALSTGLRDDAIRQSFRTTLTKKDVTDEELILVLNSLTSHELETKSKLDTCRKIRVSQLESEPVPKEKDKKQEHLSMTVNELRAEVESLKQQMGRKDNEAWRNRPRKKPPTRSCRWCEEKGDTGTVVCDHCFRCGSTEHYQRGCRKPFQQQQQQGNGSGLH